MKFFQKTIFIGLILLFRSGHAEDPSLLVYLFSGTVKDRQTGRPIPDVNIMLIGTGMGTVSLENGQFYIKRVPLGVFDVKAEVIGYDSETKQIQVNKNTRADFNLNSRPVPSNPVLVTATRSHHLQSEVPVCSEVLTQKQLAERNGTTAGEILESVGNLLVKDYGGYASLKTLSIRGSSDSQVLVLLDGQRLNTTQSGGVDLNFIPSEALERIEIIRGGLSALMGTDAVGGTVHLITKSPKGDKKLTFGTGSAIGSFESYTANAFGSVALGHSETFVIANHLQSAGNFSFIMPDQKTKEIRKNNDIRSNALLMKSRLDFESAGTFQWVCQWFQSKRGAADPVIFPSSFGRRSEVRWLTGMDWQKQISPGIQLAAQGRLHSHDNRYKSLFEDDRHRFTSFGMEAQIRWAIHAASLLQSGIEYAEDDLKSTKFQNQKRKTRSVYAELEITRQANLAGKTWELKWIPAVRSDYYTHLGFQTCPKFGMLIRTGWNNVFTIRANIGKSFRAPTFNDLYWPELIWPGFGGTKGNPNLRPETSLHYDAGIAFQKNLPLQFQAEWTYFQNRFDDLILWQSDADFVFSPINVGNSKIAGIENRFSLRSPNNRFYIELAPSWMQAFDRSAQNRNKQLIYHPNWKMDANAGMEIPPFHINGQFQQIGKRYTSSNNKKSLPAYSLFSGNVGIASKIGRIQFHIRFQIRNLLNQTIYSIADYPLPGREHRFSVDISY